MVASVNTNFIVQNGLTAGPATIFAGNGDVITSGNITVTGSGSFGGLSSNQIYQSTSNVNVNTASVTVSVAGANVATFNSQGNLTISGNLTVQGVTTTVQNETTTGNFVPSANVTYNIGSTTAWWNNIYGTAQHSLYADLAENYQADKYYNPGTVLQFGGTAEVTLADADTTRVAGVVSTNPAHLMNGALSGPNVTALALTGRVPCMVVGPVAKGDLMVSAGWGYAKSNNGAGVGQVIGKALQDFPMNSKGVIEVVVGRF